MRTRYYIDPETELPHVYGHDVSEQEVEEVLMRPGEDRPGREGSRVVIGRTSGGRYLRVIYIPDSEPDSIFVITAYDLRGKPLITFRRRHRRDEKRVKEVLVHYESQTEEEAVAEDETAFEAAGQTIMEIPTELVPKVRELLAKHRAA